MGKRKPEDFIPLALLLYIVRLQLLQSRTVLYHLNCRAVRLSVCGQMCIRDRPKKSAEGATLTKDEKPSVREELRKIKESRKEQEADTPSSLDKSSASDRAKKQPAGKIEHKQPQRKKKKPKSKETR